MDMIRAVPGNGLLIGGHRGHLSHIRENTIANFEEVYARGVPYIEIDVQLSADGVPVIFHDRDLSLRTPLYGAVCDHSVNQLKAAFDLCTLTEAIAWCKAHGMKMLLEIKSGDDHPQGQRLVLAQQIIQAISAHQFYDDCIPFSIDYGIMRIIKTALPNIHIGLIGPVSPKDPVAWMKQMRASLYVSYLKDMDAALVGRLHTAGYFVDGSIVNSKEELEKAAALQVDMIESDHPEKMIALRQGGCHA